MLESWVVVLASFGYIGLLFAIAFYADRRKREGRSIIASPVIYSLSLAVYATAWTSARKAQSIASFSQGRHGAPFALAQQ